MYITISYIWFIDEFTFFFDLLLIFFFKMEDSTSNHDEVTGTRLVLLP